MSAPPTSYVQMQKRFDWSKIAMFVMGGWSLREWALPSIFVGKGAGPDFERVVKNALKSTSAIEKVNWFDSHFSCYTEWFVEHYPGFFDSRYRFETAAKTILSSKYPIKDFPVVDQRTWRSGRLFEMFEWPHPEHTFQYGGPVILNTEGPRAHRMEQQWHGKDAKWVDMHPLHVSAASHTNATALGEAVVLNGIWSGNKDGWKRNSVKPELTSSFHTPVYYRNLFVVKYWLQPQDHFGENISDETIKEEGKAYVSWAKQFHKEFSWV